MYFLLNLMFFSTQKFTLFFNKCYWCSTILVNYSQLRFIPLIDIGIPTHIFVEFELNPYQLDELALTHTTYKR